MDADSEFELTLSLAWTRLREASTTIGPGYAHFRMDRHPETLHRMNTFVMAETYEKMLRGTGDPFTLSMPIDPDDPGRFMPVQGQEYEYFVIGKPGDYDGQTTIDRHNYEAALTTGQPTALDDLLYKLTTYEVVPYLKYL